MKTALFIEGTREGYTPGQVLYNTFTVRQLRSVLKAFDDDTEVFIQNDNGYTFGSITEETICEGWYDEDEYELYN